MIQKKNKAVSANEIKHKVISENTGNINVDTDVRLTAMRMLSLSKKY